MASSSSPHLNQSHAKTQLSKPNKMFSAISKLGRTLKLVSSIGSRNTSPQQQRFHAIIIDTSASVITSVDSQSTTRLSRIISKQFSRETVSSNATTVPSTVTSSPGSAMTLVPSLEAYTSPKRLTLIPSIESLLDTAVSSAPQAIGAVNVTHDVTGALVSQIAVSDSFDRLFRSDSSSTVASESSSSAHESAIIRRDSTAARPVSIVVPDAFAAPHECTLHDTSGDSSVELSYHSASCGPSTAETLVDEVGTPPSSPTVAFPVKTPCDVTADDSNAHSESHDDICPTIPAPAGPSAPAVQEDTPVKATIDWSTTPTWTDCFEDSDSECSSICELASDNDNTSKSLANEAESSPSSSAFDPKPTDAVPPEDDCCYGLMPSFGMAGAILMTHVFVPFVYATSEDVFAPIEDLSASWPVRVLSDIMEEDESEGDVLVIPAIRASPSHDSLLAISGDEFEYAKYSLPTESSADSCLSQGSFAVYPARPMSRCCFYADSASVDE